MQAQKLLWGVKVTGASNSIYLSEIKSKHTVDIYFIDANASVTAVTLKLQGTLDDRSVTDANAHWHDLGEVIFSAGELTAKQAMFHVADKPIQRIRLNLTTATGADGTNDLFYARYLEGE